MLAFKRLPYRMTVPLKLRSDCKRDCKEWRCDSLPDVSPAKHLHNIIRIGFGRLIMKYPCLMTKLRLCMAKWRVVDYDGYHMMFELPKLTKKHKSDPWVFKAGKPLGFLGSCGKASGNPWILKFIFRCQGIKVGYRKSTHFCDWFVVGDGWLQEIDNRSSQAFCQSIMI